MKKIMMKFCDERKRKFCIRTVIAEDEKTKKNLSVKAIFTPRVLNISREFLIIADCLKKRIQT